ncbi:hypothetical protein DXG03_003511 [Asterophora parasitica]|uniref:Uncharacterized protein n=1 Tax=Asterophora parasitica TaxID=117018 RepID=A0A9P7GAW5_9AGAR|nr:hypothetical protein DXG03_003511 [Asterophora parasitica]
MDESRGGSFSRNRIYAFQDSDVPGLPWQARYERLWKESREYVATGPIPRSPTSQMLLSRHARLDDRSVSSLRHWETSTAGYHTNTGVWGGFATWKAKASDIPESLEEIPLEMTRGTYKVPSDHPHDIFTSPAESHPRKGILLNHSNLNPVVVPSRGTKLALPPGVMANGPGCPYHPLPITTPSTSSPTDDCARKKMRPDVPPRDEKLLFPIDEGFNKDSKLSSKSNIDLAADRILEILMGYYPAGRGSESEESIIPTVAFLATWFLARLFPEGLLGASATIRALDAVEILVRSCLLGFTFANKWLDDHSHPHKSWIHFCTLPLSSINLVEKVALQLLDYDISITNCEWRAWLANLAPTTDNFIEAGNGQITATRALEEALHKAEHFGRLGSVSKRREIISSPLSGKLSARLLEGLQTRR